MHIYIDADASPVQKDVIEIAKIYRLPVILVKSYAHFSHDVTDTHVETIYVDATKEAADFEIVKRVKKDDLVITQDYGLASLCLPKGCHVLHHKGFLYTEKNISSLLASRHASAKARRAGYKTKGPRRYTEEERERFRSLLKKVIEHHFDKDL